MLATNQSLANASYAHDQTVLMFAASVSQRDSARLLIEHGAKIDAKNALGWTALHIACALGANEVAEELLRAGAHLDGRNQAALLRCIWLRMNGCNDMVRVAPWITEPM